MKPTGRAKKAKSKKTSVKRKSLRLTKRLDSATTQKLKLFRAKEQQAKEDKARQREMQLRQKLAEKEAKTRINIVVHFGDMNIVSLVLPINTPRKRLRFELRKRYKRINRAELTFPNGEKLVIKYTHPSKVSVKNLAGIENATVIPAPVSN